MVSRWTGLVPQAFWLAAFAGALLGSQPGNTANAGMLDFDALPPGIESVASWIAYDGINDDLLTAGLGISGIASPLPPTFVDAKNPTAAELRRLAIYSNYRALVDTTSGGGYGRLYGPNIDAGGGDTLGEGLVPGIEVIAFANPDDGEDDAEQHNVTMMVQVPESFDPANACIVTAPSSGSRGVYGAIGTSGDWGLKNGCAVAYTDKGTGTGAHNLTDNTVGLIDGLRADAAAAGSASTFTARLSDSQRVRFSQTYPDRFAFKHAHSHLNPERDWGNNVLTSIKFAFYVLNQEFPEAELAPANTIVIASSVSNGGGSSVLAAEQDTHGLIDGIAVSEPNVNPVFDPGFTIIQGSATPFAAHSQSLNAYYSVLNVYLGCAAAAPALAAAPLNLAPSAARCAKLAAIGLLSGQSTETQAIEAQAIINESGFLPEQNILAPSHWFINVPQAIGVTYSNAYGRFSVTENLCGYSFAAADGVVPAPLGAEAEAALFAVSNGIPPTAGLQLINNLGPNGPQVDRVSTPEQNLEGHLCLRALASGQDPVTGAALNGQDRRAHQRILAGIGKIRASGDLHGLPAIFVTGRADAILPPNHTSRAYFGLNNRIEGDASALSYVEVLNAQHLDALNAFEAFGFADLYIPLHHYFIQALDLMLDHLRDGAALPPSQVVRTTPRQRDTSGTLMPVTVADNLPPIAATPATGSEIVFNGSSVLIPD